MDIKEQIKEWSKLVVEDTEQLNEAWTVDLNFFKGEGGYEKPMVDALKNMKKIDSKRGVVEDVDGKMYAISGRLIHWLAESIDEIFTKERPMEKAEALDHVREFFARNDFWEEVPESENHKKGREHAEWEAKYRSRGDNFTGD